jgi:CBS domain-containing protein
MANDVVTVGLDDGIKSAARKMVEHGVGGLPVVDSEGALVGIITESDFLEQEADKSEQRYHRLVDALFGNRRHRPLGDTVAEAMTADPVTIDIDALLAEAARIMRHHKVKRLPVVDGNGHLQGIVSVSDILQAFVRPDDEIAGQIRSDVARRVLLLDDEQLDIAVVEGVVQLGGVVPTRTEARLLEELVSRLDGVIRIESGLMWEVDDSIPPENRDRVV